MSMVTGVRTSWETMPRELILHRERGLQLGESAGTVEVECGAAGELEPGLEILIIERFATARSEERHGPEGAALDREGRKDGGAGGGLVEEPCVLLVNEVLAHGGDAEPRHEERLARCDHGVSGIALFAGFRGVAPQPVLEVWEAEVGHCDGDSLRTLGAEEVDHDDIGEGRDTAPGGGIDGLAEGGGGGHPEIGAIEQLRAVACAFEVGFEIAFVVDFDTGRDPGGDRPVGGVFERAYLPLVPAVVTIVATEPAFDLVGLTGGPARAPGGEDGFDIGLVGQLQGRQPGVRRTRVTGERLVCVADGAGGFDDEDVDGHEVERGGIEKRRARLRGHWVGQRYRRRRGGWRRGGPIGRFPAYERRWYWEAGCERITAPAREGEAERARNQ